MLRRRAQAALLGHLPKALRRRPQVVALDLTLLPYYGADRQDQPLRRPHQAKKGTCSFFGYGTAYVIRKGWRYTVALMAATRKTTMAELVRELLRQVRAAGIKVRYIGPGPRVLQRRGHPLSPAARTPFLMPVVGHGPLGQTSAGSQRLERLQAVQGRAAGASTR